MNASALLRLSMVALALLLLFPTSGAAFIRMPTWDDVLVDKSELIVIAHLKENRFEIAKDPLSSQPDRKVFFTTLVVTQVLKGSAAAGDLRVGLHDPTYPTVLTKGPVFVPPQAGEHPDASAAVGVAAIMGTIFAVSTDDVRQDHIWFLSTVPPYPLRAADVAKEPGLWFPEGVQPVKLVPFYQAIMAGDADAVAAFADADPKSWWSHRVDFCQANLRVKEAAAIPDANARCDALLALFTQGNPYTPAGATALKDIMACGDLGAAKLVPVFEDAQNHELDRRAILNAWQQAGYKGAPPAIVRWLRNEDVWWSTKSVADMSFGAKDGQKGGDPYNDPRAVSFRNIYCSIEALGGNHNPEAALLVLQIRGRWQAAAPFDSNNDLLKACDDALAAMK